jgi:glycosyltransferase involved in cell wall biosynthesis
MKYVELIVNVCNGEEYLFDTLISLVNQDYPYLKIHCFDNHSTDKTIDIINDFKLKHDNILYYRTPSYMPLVDARLFALSEIKKQQKETFYFGFCDADDLWEVNWVSSLMKFSNQDYNLLICNGYTLKGDIKAPYNSCLSMSRPSPFNCPVSVQSCLFNSNLIVKNKPLFDSSFPMIWDTEFWIRQGKGLTYVHISNHLFYYRIHPGSLVQKNFFSILRERWGILKLHNLSLTRFLFDFFRQLKSIIFNFK